ncbi:manno-octulosonate cytidylyltransferase [Sulfitobacter sp. R18_1]|uniref:3-deoxy-manno-octulosonate cytidylyltransferase family protein n=1 Tax=Sulfitobacter sp. R18_1 TaxID=2821104 RepID=UPI001AD9E5AC|nr:manno-octulosonate cytidylyltransferase [Sulfitobacter sp. R18_1]MBO9428375.1 3-deoxy-manno-octulosonate cytidylyltransferase [Sulfitobacter sp. R18_1]
MTVNKRVLIVIPARYASTRYPGKPLAELTGATGKTKSLVQRSWEAAMSVKVADKVVVATDSEEICKHARSFGAEVVMTPESCANGTERCSYVAKKYRNYDIIVNLQGDAPLTPAAFVEDLVLAFDDPNIAVATPVLRCDAEALAGFKNDRANGRVGGTTVVFNNKMEALYFSKEVLPYTGEGVPEEMRMPVFHHVGVYGYRREALARYMDLREGRWEKWEGLEQLRFLENSVKVKCVEMGRGYQFWELNNPTDVPIIEKMLREAGIE